MTRRSRLVSKHHRDGVGVSRDLFRLRSIQRVQCCHRFLARLPPLHPLLHLPPVWRRKCSPPGGRKRKSGYAFLTRILVAPRAGLECIVGDLAPRMSSVRYTQTELSPKRRVSKKSIQDRWISIPPDRKPRAKSRRGPR